MYLPDHFAEPDTARLHQLIQAQPLGSLVTLGADGNPVLDVLPFFLDAPIHGGATRLLAHVARNNPLWHTHPQSRPVLVSFQGPNAYISPNWYPTKAAHGKAVPTWNYVAVQALGLMRVVDGDPVWMRAFLARLTEAHEAAQPQPWHINDAPASYIDGMLRAVVGLDIEVTQLTGKFKLSQNQPEVNRMGVRDALAASPDPVARATLAWAPST